MVIQIETPPLIINQGGGGSGGSALVKKGNWNASINSPSLPIATIENQGDYYVVSASGTTNINGITDWKVGDILFSNGTAWQKIDQSESVTSVAGRTGNVVLTSADIQDLNIDLTSKIEWKLPPPATRNSEGLAGQVSYDDDYYYICVNINTWGRIPILKGW